MAVSPFHSQVKLSEFGVCLILAQIKMHALLNEPFDALATATYCEMDGRLVA